MRKKSVTLALLLALHGGLASTAVSAALAQQPRLIVNPAVVPRGQNAIVAVSRIDVPSLEVRIVGGTRNLGQPVPWTPLHHHGFVWRGRLPAPELRGVYALELRVRPGSPILRSRRWLLPVLARGTRSRPSFATPEGVARWWVRTLPLAGRLVALKRWPPPAFDKRDHRWHQELVVAYTLAGHRANRDRLGMFVTAIRESVHARWRLLQATVVP
jgi:hypothetical protein